MTVLAWFLVGGVTGVAWVAAGWVLSLFLGRVFQLRDDALENGPDLLEDEYRRLLEREGGRP